MVRFYLRGCLEAALFSETVKIGINIFKDSPTRLRLSYSIRIGIKLSFHSKTNLKVHQTSHCLPLYDASITAKPFAVGRLHPNSLQSVPTWCSTTCKGSFSLQTLLLLQTCLWMAPQLLETPFLLKHLSYCKPVTR